MAIFKDEFELSNLFLSFVRIILIEFNWERKNQLITIQSNLLSNFPIGTGNRIRFLVERVIQFPNATPMLLHCTRNHFLLII